jgi:hypothetical protein
MNKSESIKELASALCKAQDSMGGAVKGKANPFFKSKYADLSAIIQAIKEPFAKNGLSYTQFPIESEGRIGIETMLMHSSGEWLAQSFTVQLTKQDAQGAGSAITYCRRYGLQAVAGIPSEDDDGNGAVNKKAPAALASDTRLVDHNEAVRDNLSSIMYVKDALAGSRWDEAAEAMRELDDDTRMALGVASTKGGIFTIEETKLFGSPEYKEAVNRYFEERK